MNIVITGTSRGIGLELCRQALQNSPQLLAIARNPAAHPELNALKVKTLDVDLTKPEAPAQIADAVRDWSHVDLLINNAGIYRAGETSQDFAESFHVNSIVPFLLTQALLPALKKSKQPKAVHISSMMGSIADNTSGGAYAYRASKTALNMIVHSLAVDQPWLTSAVLHPGWVQTDMGGANATTPVKESVAGLWHVIDNLKKEQSGKFYDFRGRELPW